MHGQRPGTGPGEERPAKVPPEIAAEAAVWVARLHGPDRSSRMERECRAWQARSPVHRLAFERCTDTWQDVDLVTLRTYAAASAVDTASAGMRSSSRRIGLGLALAAFGVVVASVLVVIRPWRDAERYSTEVGEQRVVMLSDGSRMSLNTGTRVSVEFSPARRTIGVEAGEALFEVAKDASRPFIVRAGDSEVVAVGTVFAVRLNGRTTGVGPALDVMLVEGRVTVRAASAGPRGLAPSAPVSMSAGDRVRLAQKAEPEGGAVMKLDRPRIDQVIAWRRDEVVFEDVALTDAAAEMNRYSRRPLVLLGGSRRLRVSGLFRTGDSVGFARAVAALHRLVVREYPDRLELAPN